jgi:hypothetical protein
MSTATDREDKMGDPDMYRIVSQPEVMHLGGESGILALNFSRTKYVNYYLPPKLISIFNCMHSTCMMHVKCIHDLCSLLAYISFYLSTLLYLLRLTY